MNKEKISKLQELSAKLQAEKKTTKEGRLKRMSLIINPKIYGSERKSD